MRKRSFFSLYWGDWVRFVLEPGELRLVVVAAAAGAVNGYATLTLTSHPTGQREATPCPALTQTSSLGEGRATDTQSREAHWHGSPSDTHFHRSPPPDLPPHVMLS